MSQYASTTTRQSNRRRQEKELRELIIKLDAEIKEMDHWFIRNVCAVDWTDKITAYWVKHSLREAAAQKLVMLSDRTIKTPMYNTIKKQNANNNTIR